MPLYRLFYHFVWSTKNRLPLIIDANRNEIFASIRAKATELKAITHALNGMPDHLHLVVTVPPSLALSTFIGQVKGVSSHLVGQRHTEPFAWQGEYGVLSISEAHVPVVVRYVVEQQRHHTSGALDDRLERMSEASES